MKRDLAETVKIKALNAVKELNSIVLEDFDWDAPENYNLKKGIGLSIGRIEIEILGVIYKKYPDLDDLI